MPDEWSMISYLKPEEALEAINQPDPLPPLVDRCFTMDSSNPNEPVIHLSISALEQEIKLVERFMRVSVLMVDYAMPTLNGLEFCERVANRDIKIALLTGVADEKTAVAAFNQGIIDRYIPKGVLAATRNIIPHIQTLQTAYFEQYSARLSSNLALNPPAFMTDAILRPHFDNIISQFNIVEYYLTGEPYGYLMLTADGTMVRLVVLSQRELDRQIALAQQYRAPEKMINKMRDGKLIGYLYEHPGDYLGHEAYPWDEVLIGANRVEGDQTWYLGVAENPPADIDFQANLSSYNSFLQLDRTLV